MRQSEFFTRTLRHDPEGEETKNAKLLTRAGFVSKSSAGVYTLLPLGLRVLEKINRVIREEMNAIGGEELLMPALVDRKYWEKTNRWQTEVVYRTGRKSHSGKMDEHDFEYGLGWTHEEVIAAIALNYIQSYKDLPKCVYQIQMKFRAEARAQGGLLRGREFLMKDLYSFHADHEDLNRYYEIVKAAYDKIFKRLGLKALVVEASGGAFTKEFTHEFQVLNPAGEDNIHYCAECGFAMNKEVFDAKRHTSCSGEIKTGRGIEVGNIFRLGTRFSEAFGLSYADKSGKKHPVVMGSYGIGPTRVLGALVEEYNDERGIIWPEAVAPFKVHLVYLPSSDVNVKKRSDRIYGALSPRGRSPAGRKKAGVEVLYDDRAEASVGEKFADADLIGIPYRAVVSQKTGAKIEIKRRNEKETQLSTSESFLKLVTKP